MRPDIRKNSLSLPYKVAWLALCIPPYTAPLFRALTARFDQFRAFLSVDMEPGRHWPVQWVDLDVQLQRTFTWRGTWRHPQGFSEPAYVHIPYDTLGVLKQYDPDVVISSELGWRTLQALAYRRWRRRSRFLIRATLSERTEQGRSRPREWLRRFLLRGADGVMVNGRSGADYVGRFKVPGDKLFITPSTTNIAPFSSVALQRLDQSSHRLIYVGQLAERKGLLPFVETLSRWAMEHGNSFVQFWIVGDGPLRPKLAQTSWPPNLEVRFLGNVAYEDLPMLYAQGRILVFPTLADEWGMVVNEALAAGLPVLGSLYSQAVEELVQEGVNGWTVRPDQPQEMFFALNRALTTSNECLDRMRIAARESVVHLTPEFVADRVVEAVCSVCR
jgi:glycosyltransferase involved in cell wall biosynthesis